MKATVTLPPATVPALVIESLTQAEVNKLITYWTNAPWVEHMIVKVELENGDQFRRG